MDVKSKFWATIYILEYKLGNFRKCEIIKKVHNWEIEISISLKWNRKGKEN